MISTCAAQSVDTFVGLYLFPLFLLKSTFDTMFTDRPSFACKDHYEVEVSGSSQTPCEPQGLPRPDITWLKDGKEIPTPQRWTRHDSGNYSLRATNKHGEATHALYLDVLCKFYCLELHFFVFIICCWWWIQVGSFFISGLILFFSDAPEFKEGNYTKDVILGENVTLTCSAEGNPAPEIHWKYKDIPNVIQTTWRRQRNINITKATSTNAGVYNCTATNKVGAVTRAVRVAVKGTSRCWCFYR